jgi:hypothetical protein
MNVRYYVSDKLRQIDETIENEKAYFEDVEGAAIRYAHQGAKISRERWIEIANLGLKTDHKVDALQLIKDVLRNHFVVANSDKNKDFFKDKIRTEVLPELEQKENYEGCLVVLQFINDF